MRHYDSHFYKGLMQQNNYFVRKQPRHNGNEKAHVCIAPELSLY